MCDHALRSVTYRPRGLDNEDVCQRLFVKAFDNQWRPDKSPLTAWFRLIAKRIVLDVVKSSYERRTRGQFPFPSEPNETCYGNSSCGFGNGAPDEVVAIQETRKAVRLALEDLPFQARQVLALRFVEGHHLQDIADALGLSRTTLVRRIQESLDLLAKRLPDLGQGGMPDKGS
ncbi:MAG: sigma-70 family RNA polymerase sigma factor [Pirellulaceae bacterium]